MAQLTDDCFAFGAELMPVETALALIAQRIAPVAGIAGVAVGKSDGRVVADDVRAPIALPPFDNSAVDGYAVRHADLAAAGATTLQLRGRIAAGGSPTSLSAR